MGEEKTLGRYTLLDEIARGGMGVIYRAHDPVMDRAVAIKVLNTEDPEDTERFQMEVRTAAQLPHPGIIKIYDVGFDFEQGKNYFTMDLIEGPALSDLIKENGMLPPRAAARIARDLAQALEVAHEKGIIHRDIKPGNVLLQAEGRELQKTPTVDTSIRIGDGYTDRYRVVLTDFELAKALNIDKKLTLTGSLLGTPSYMSPEQAAGDPIDLRSDVYSLGAVLYEMISGQCPVDGENVNQVLLQIIHQDPPTLPVALSPDLRTIVSKSMAKERDRRYQTARDFSEDLDRYLRGEAITARPPTISYRVKKWFVRHKALATALLVFATALLTGAAYLFGPAWVEIDGEETMYWPAGTQTVRFVKPGWEPQEAELQLVPWKVTKWSPPRIADHGFVRVETEPPGAEVVFVVGGRPSVRAKADGRPVRLPRGTHEIRLRLPNHQEMVSPVHIPAGETIEFRRRLVHEVGTLSISCEPPGIKMKAVPLDESGETLGAFGLPDDNLHLPTGRYRLVFEKENHFQRQREVTLRQGERRTLRATLNSMQVWSFSTRGPIPGGATVTEVDGDGVPDCFVGSTDNHVYALSGRDGTRLWEYATLDKIRAAPTAADADADGVPDCIVGSRDGHLYVLSGRDGTLLWKFDAGAAVESAAASVDLDGDRRPDFIFGSTNGRVFALSGRDGSELWSAKTGGRVVSTPSLADLNDDGTPDAVIGSYDEQVYAFSGRDGAELWSFKASDKIRSSPILVEVNGDGTPDCFIASYDGKVYALSGKDGGAIWMVGVGGKIRTSPSAVDLNRDGTPDCVIGCNDTNVYALSGKDGTPLWTCKTGGQVWSTAAVLHLDLDAVPDLLIGSHDSRVHAISGTDGRRLWSFRTAGEVWSPPVLADLDRDTLPDFYVASNDGRVYAVRGRDSARVWEYKIPAEIWSPPVATEVDGDDRPDCFFGSYDGYVFALAGRDGTLLWKYRTAGPVVAQPAAVDLTGDGVPDCIATGHDFRVYALSGRDGSLIWKYKTRSQVWSSPTTADLNRDGTPDVVVGSNDYSVYALSGKDGTLLWSYKTRGAVRTTPALADLNGDGVKDCVVGSWDSRVYAINGIDGTLLWQYRTRRQVRAAPIILALDQDATPDVLAASMDNQLYALSGIDGKPLWKFPLQARVSSCDAIADLDGDGVSECLVGTTGERVFALSGRTGKPVWSFRCGGEVWSKTVSDIDRDGTVDCLVGSTDGNVYLLSGRDGTPLCVTPGAGERAVLSRGMILSGSADGTLSVWEVRPARPAVAALVRAEAWTAVLRAVSEKSDIRGRALLRTGRKTEAIECFQKADEAGLASPELHADWIEAGGSPVMERIHPWAAALLKDRLTAEQRSRIVGDAPHLLILAGKYEEALKRLPEGETWDARALALRSLAKSGKGNTEGARVDLDQALRQNPYHRGLRRLRRDLD